MVVAFIAALVVAAGMGYWLVARARLRAGGTSAHTAKAGPGPTPAKTALAKTGGRYAAVEIRARGGACRAATELQGQRFLAKNAPALPLPKCTATQCACAFSKLPDRRTEGRRLDFGGLHASQFLHNNRRTKRDRRGAARARQRP
jgi:hypothetical protein